MKKRIKENDFLGYFKIGDDMNKKEKLTEEEVIKINYWFKCKLVNLCHEFDEKFLVSDSDHYPQAAYIRITVITELLEELFSRLTNQKMFFTHRQIDHICYKIGEWYLIWKDKLLVNTKTAEHRLGYAKEMLKMMIVDEDE